MDELRFRSQHSPRTETPMNAFVSPPRNGARLPPQSPHDPRSNMPRRFTTDSARVPTLSSITSTMTSPQRVSIPDSVSQDYNVSNLFPILFSSASSYSPLSSRPTDGSGPDTTQSPVGMCLFQSLRPPPFSLSFSLCLFHFEFRPQLRPLSMVQMLSMIVLMAGAGLQHKSLQPSLA